MIKTMLKIPSQIYLLVGILSFIFVFPLIDQNTIFDFIGPISYSIITLSILSVIEKKKQEKMKYLFVMIAFSLTLLWSFYLFPNPVLRVISFLLSISVYLVATALLISQVVKSKEVTVAVIVEAICAYLLIGVMFTLTNTLIWAFNHESFNMANVDVADMIYYSYISIITIGYGDILPLSDLAKLSAVFFGLCGQLYLTIIMALIIGKFLNRKQTI